MDRYVKDAGMRREMKMRLRALLDEIIEDVRELGRECDGYVNYVDIMYVIGGDAGIGVDPGEWDPDEKRNSCALFHCLVEEGIIEEAPEDYPYCYRVR